MAQPTIDKTPSARKGRRENAKSSQTAPTLGPDPVADKSSDLTFITSEGEILMFSNMNLPLGDAAAIAGEEALHKIWDRPTEDAAWRDM